MDQTQAGGLRPVDDFGPKYHAASQGATKAPNIGPQDMTDQSFHAGSEH